MTATGSARLWGAGAFVASGLLAFFLSLDYQQILNGGLSRGVEPGPFYLIQLLAIAAAGALTFRALSALARPAGPVSVVLGIMAVTGPALAGVAALNLAYFVRGAGLGSLDFHLLRGVIEAELIPLLAGLTLAWLAARGLGADVAERRRLLRWTVATGFGFVAATAMAFILSLPPFQRLSQTLIGLSPGFRTFWLAAAVVAFALAALAARAALRSEYPQVAPPAAAAAVALTALAGVSAAVRPVALAAVSSTRVPTHTARWTITWLVIGLCYAGIAAAAAARIERRSAPARTPV